MADRGEEYRLIGEQRVRIAWRKAGFGEWLAWCYLPGPEGLHNQGTGFDARARTAQEAVAQVAQRVEQHMNG